MTELTWRIKTSALVVWLADRWEWFNETFSIIEPEFPDDFSLVKQPFELWR